MINHHCEKKHFYPNTEYETMADIINYSNDFDNIKVFQKNKRK